MIRYFGDGYQVAKKFDDRRFWRIPTMDGEFLCEDFFGTVTGVAGGNLLICGKDVRSALEAAEKAVEAIAGPDVILPFPGGIVRSGSKVGSRYSKLKASTNEAFCPTLRGLVQTELPKECNAVYEIVIDGLSFEAVQAAMKRGLHAAASSPNVVRITAGNYGGKLGKHHFHLRDLV
jgi:formylmethanofuran--tetrahydromethanopterin N-formyltransferase